VAAVFPVPLISLCGMAVILAIGLRYAFLMRRGAGVTTAK
jgi:predicted exporter